MKRRVLLRLGRRGDQVVVREDRAQGYYIVHYRIEDGIERKLKFALSREGRDEALRFAEGWHGERARMREERTRTATVTMRQMWTAYQEHEFPALRPATRISYRGHWRRWELFVGPDRNPETVTLTDAAQFRAAAVRQGIAMNQVRQTLAVVKIVFMWAHRYEMIERNRMALHRWKQAKDTVVAEPAEYSDDEYERLLRALGGGQRADRWRAWAVVALAGEYGQRANAVRHLAWSDIDWAAGEIVWPAQYQKQGKPLHRPITDAARAILETCRHWRAVARAGVNDRPRRDRLPNSRPAALDRSPWVVFARNDKTKPVSYSSIHGHLVKAERAAGITHRELRALHGLRKRVVTRVVEQTGDRMLGLEYVGDTDPKMLKRYDKGLDARIQQAAVALGTSPNGPRETSPNRPEADTAPMGADGDR